MLNGGFATLDISLPRRRSRWATTAASLAVLALGACQEPELGELFVVDVGTDGPSEVAIIGDYGNASDNEAAVADLVHSLQPAAVVTAGDNSYGTFGIDNAAANIGTYYCDYIYNPTAPAELRCGGRATDAAQNRFFPSIGNHDYKSDDDISPYLEYFDLPHNEKYYSVRVGAVEFFILDSQRWSTYPAQKRWLEEATERSTAPFKVAVFHHPPYSTGHHGDTKRMRWDFDEYGIRLVISGHDHDYQRFEVDGVTYIVNGVGGAELRHDCGETRSKSGARKSCLDSEYGALLLTATGELMQVDFHSVAEGYPVRDSYTIQR